MLKNYHYVIKHLASLAEYQNNLHLKDYYYRYLHTIGLPITKREVDSTFDSSYSGDLSLLIFHLMFLQYHLA